MKKLYDLIVLDCDGVLADFVGGVIRLLNLDRDAVMEKWPKGEYDVAKMVGLSETEFWLKVEEGGEPFWYGLDALPWMHGLYEASRKLACQVVVATSPSLDPSCAAGKTHWLQQHFGPNFRDYAITPRKELLANPGVLLIDDSEENVKAFRTRGGQALVLPQRWNNAAEVPPSEVVPYVVEQAERLCPKFEIPLNMTWLELCA